jgi:hypothetical protein
MSMQITDGHGHVTPRADGDKAKCGGPGLCAQCTNELAIFTQMNRNIQGVSGAISTQGNYWQGSFSDSQLKNQGASKPAAGPSPKTLRDEFAMAALNGVLTKKGMFSFSQAAKDAYEIADEAMKAREVQS